jgi:hypothetical protein
MEKELAGQLIRSALRSSSEQESALQLLKQQLQPADYKRYALGIASATDAINQALLNPALAEFPELSQEVEASLRKHGRYL